MNLDLEDSMKTCTSLQLSVVARPLSFEQNNIKTKKCMTEDKQIIVAFCNMNL